LAEQHARVAGLVQALAASPGSSTGLTVVRELLPNPEECAHADSEVTAELWMASALADAELRLRVGDLDGATASLRAVDPDAPRVRLGTGRVEAARGDVEAARSSLHAAMDAGFAAADRDTVAAASFELARLHLADDRLAAERWLEHGEAAVERAVAQLRLRSEASAIRAELQARQGRNDAAVDSLETAVEQLRRAIGSGSMTEAILLMRRAELRDDLRAARDDLERSVQVLERLGAETDPRFIDALQRLAQCYDALQESDAARLTRLRAQTLHRGGASLAAARAGF